MMLGPRMLLAVLLGGTPATAGGRSPPNNATEAPPPTSYRLELEIRKRETTIATDRKRAIALLEEFITEHESSNALPEALYRLAALYWERSQQRFLTAMKTWANAVERCKAAPETCPKGPPSAPNLELGESQTIYVRLIRDFPRFRKIDTVHYLYGFSLRDQGRVEEAQQQFWSIIRRHPGSTFVPDSWLAIGDHRFYDANDFEAALEAYGHVLDHPRSDAYAMALFKSAWCHWKLGDRDAAILRFKQVLDQATDPQQDASGRRRLDDLRQEALEYLVQVISEDEAQTPQDIHDFLASIGGAKYSRKVLVRLARAYEAQTRYDKSVPTWRFLIALDSNHRDNAGFQVHVFTGVRGEGKTTEALDELTKLYEGYGPKSAWGKAHAAQSRDAHDRGEALLYEFARSIHEGAQAHEKDTKVADAERYALAVRAYDDYVARFPANPRAVELSYLAGDIYSFKLRQPQKAGDAYLRVGESAPVGPLHRDALLAAIAAYEQVMQTSVAVAPTRPVSPAATPRAAESSSTKPSKPPSDTRSSSPEDDAGSSAPPDGAIDFKFIRAIELFAELFPRDDEIGAVVYKLGDFFHGRGDYDAAIQRFGRVVVDHPGSSHAGAAGDRILESLKLAKDFDNIELWAQKLKGTRAFSAQDEQRRLDRIIVDSLLKQGETLASRGYFARAAGYFLRVASEYPKHDKVPTALNNAGAALERADRADVATEVYKQLAAEHPNTREGADAALIVARVYENIARYEEAAKNYDRLIERYPAHEARADALYNAGMLYLALGKNKLAIERFSRYVKHHGARQDAIEIELRVGQALAKIGQHRSAVDEFEKFERRHPTDAHSVEAATRRGEALVALGKFKEADKAFTKAAKAALSLEGMARVFGARARFRQGDLVHRRFEEAKLDPRPTKLGASLERKAKLLAEAKDVYLTVLDYRSAEWSTAALYRIGESYEKFAQSLRAYPVPKKLSRAEQDQYMEQLDTFALAFEEQAIESYKSGYVKALELRIYNEHCRKLRTALGRLSKREFPPIAEIGTDVVVAEGGGRGGRAIRRLSR